MNLHQLKLLHVNTCRNDLNIYKKNELESNFIEIVNPKNQLL